MKAALVEKYGSLELRDVEQPEPGSAEVLIRVRAISLNAVDWYAYSGRLYAARLMMGVRTPKEPALGGDFAGIVEAVGDDAPFAIGDEVYGHQRGAFAEHMIGSRAVERKPASLTFEEAAAVPLAGLTALQGLRDHAALQPGQKVLVNGASGGVGTFAVQIGRALGAEVHAVCSERNVQQARELGAARVFDYTREDFTRSGVHYDVLFDNAGNRSWAAMRRVLTPNAKVVLIGGPRRNRVLGPLGHIARIKLVAQLGGRTASFFVANLNREDLVALRELIESGQVRPVVAERYAFSELAEALRGMSDGHARGKIVLTVSG